MSEPTLVITRGLPGSGKSSIARKWARQEPGHRAVIARDTFRQEFFARKEGRLSKKEEDAITSLLEHQVTELLGRGFSVCVDAMHVKLAYARHWATVARDRGYAFEVLDVTTDVDTCVERDRRRGERGGRTVGEQVIRDIAARYHDPFQPVTPYDKAERADLAHHRIAYVPDTDLPAAIIVDIDGTVAEKNLGRGSRAWHDYSRVGEDNPKPIIMSIVSAFAMLAGARLIFVSGREDSCRDETIEWLGVHHGVKIEDGGDELWMRKTSDHRNDAIVKYELFDAHIRNRFNVLAAFDDRNRVVDMWRSIGLTCLQVAPGDF